MPEKRLAEETIAARAGAGVLRNRNRIPRQCLVSAGAKPEESAVVAVGASTNSRGAEVCSPN